MNDVELIRLESFISSPRSPPPPPVLSSTSSHTSPQQPSTPLSWATLPSSPSNGHHVVADSTITTTSTTTTSPTTNQSTRDLSHLKNFSSNFWGDKTNGFDVLCQNLRISLASVKELEAFIKDTQQIEEMYTKQMSKLSAQIGRYSNESSVSPLWHSAIKETCERNCKSHLLFCTRLSELARDVQSYGDELRKKRKRMKEVEARTASMVEQFRSVKSQMQRAREAYLTMAAEIERQKRGILQEVNSSGGGGGGSSGGYIDKQTSTAPLQQSNSGSSSSSNFPLAMVASQIGFVSAVAGTSIGKMEKKLQQASDEYRQAIDKYNVTREDYIELFRASCHSFQTYEEAHVQQMSKFVGVYAHHLQQLNEARAHVQADLRQKLDNVYSVDSLIQQFLVHKGTGHDVPEYGEFVEYTAGIVNEMGVGNGSGSGSSSGVGASVHTATTAANSSYFQTPQHSVDDSVIGQTGKRNSHLNSSNRKPDTLGPLLQSILDPFEIPPVPASGGKQNDRASTPNGESPSTPHQQQRKRTATDNRLFGLINLEFFGKIMNNNNNNSNAATTGANGAATTPTTGSDQAAASGSHHNHHHHHLYLGGNRSHRAGSALAAATPTIAESQLIDLGIGDSGENVNNLVEKEETNPGAVAAAAAADRSSRGREMFQKARPMRIIAKVGAARSRKNNNNSTNRQNSLPSDSNIAMSGLGGGALTGDETVEKSQTKKAKQKQSGGSKSKTVGNKNATSMANPVMARSSTTSGGDEDDPNDNDVDVVDDEEDNDDDDDGDDFDESEFDNLRTKGIVPGSIVSNALDDDDDFFREFQQIQQKKTTSGGRKDSADMNNLYESSPGNSPPRTTNKNKSQHHATTTMIDLNNNNTMSPTSLNQKQKVARGVVANSSDSSDSSDTDSDDSDEPKRIFVQIKPVGDPTMSQTTTTDTQLSLIGKSLKLPSTTSNPTNGGMSSSRRARAMSPTPVSSSSIAMTDRSIDLANATTATNQPLSKSIDETSLSDAFHMAMKLQQNTTVSSKSPPPTIPGTTTGAPTQTPPPHPTTPRPAPPLPPPPPTNLKPYLIFQRLGGSTSPNSSSPSSSFTAAPNTVSTTNSSSSNERKSMSPIPPPMPPRSTPPPPPPSNSTAPPNAAPNSAAKAATNPRFIVFQKPAPPLVNTNNNTSNNPSHEIKQKTTPDASASQVANSSSPSDSATQYAQF